MKDSFSVDLHALSPLTGAWQPSLSPLRDPTKIAEEYGREIADKLDPGDKANLRLWVMSAVPWILVKGLHDPSGVTQRTPQDLQPAHKREEWWPAAYSALALLGALGLRVVSYRCENSGCAFVHLSPHPGQGARAENSIQMMGGHTDALHFPFPHEYNARKNDASPAPDFVVLTAIRNPNRTNTLVVRLSKLLDIISSRAQDELRKPIYLFSKQDTFRGPPTELIGYPVLSRHPLYGDFIRFSSSRVSVEAERFPDAEIALKELREAIPKCREAVYVAPGDVLLVNNRAALHGREAIARPEYGNTGRWLLRTYGLRQDTPGRFEKLEPHLLRCGL